MFPITSISTEDTYIYSAYIYIYNDFKCSPCLELQGVFFHTIKAFHKV